MSNLIRIDFQTKQRLPDPPEESHAMDIKTWLDLDQNQMFMKINPYDGCFGFDLTQAKALRDAFIYTVATWEHFLVTGELNENLFR